MSMTITATPYVIDTGDNIAIGDIVSNLGNDAFGDGWKWSEGNDTLTLTGDDIDLGEIAFFTYQDITITVAGDGDAAASATADSIVNIGTGGVTISIPDELITRSFSPRFPTVRIR